MDDRWAEFFDRFVLPVLSIVGWIAAVILVLVLVARLIVLLPVWKKTVITIRHSAQATWGGMIAITLIACTAVLMPATLDPETTLWPVVLVAALAVLAVLVLALGLATSPRLDASVVESSGATNGAWAIDVLAQIKDAHHESNDARILSANTPDIGDLVLVADRSGSGMAALFASIWQLLFNTSPWQLQITILDGVTAAAKLRRNGHGVEDELLVLEYGDSTGESHRKLLSMAAAFATINLSLRYPDLTGYYRVTSWRSAAYTALANVTGGDERSHYIERALAEDPRNLVAEYAEVLDAFADENDITVLCDRLDRLEQMIDKAATLSGRQPPLGVEPEPWHLVPASKARPEPPFMMLRLMRFYLGTARNLIAALTRQRDVAEDVDVEFRRDHVNAVLFASINFLDDLTPAKRGRAKVRLDKGQDAELQRLRMIASIDQNILGSWAGVVPREALQDRLDEWFDASMDSLDAEVSYQHACWLAHVIATEPPVDDDPEGLLETLIGLVRYSHFVPWFREWTFSDPELRLLGREPALRELALADVQSPWALARFAAAVDGPIGRMPDPALLSELELAALKGTVTKQELERISDGVQILRAIRAAAPPQFREVDVLRIAKYLIDEEDHNLGTLSACLRYGSDRLSDGIAAAVFWVPRDAERASAVQFVEAMRDNLAQPAS